MTLRLRLLLIIGLSFTLLWAGASVWTLLGLRSEMGAALDERLAASAHMVAGLAGQLPRAPAAAIAAPARLPALDALAGVACEIRQQRGALLARTGNSPANLALAPAGYGTRSVDAVHWRTYTLEQDGLRITTADRVERRQQLWLQVAAAMGVPFLVAMAGSLVALWFGIRHGLAPLEDMRTALAARAPEALQALAPPRVPAELAPLVATINALLARTGRAIDRERSFTGDAAHELRTPLTAVKTHIQVARLSAGAAGADTALAQAEAGVLRLQAIIDQLLMLTRLEGPFPFDEQDTASARTVAERAIAQLGAGPQRRVALAACAQVSVAVPSVLAETALRNLLDNALRYSPGDSAVALRIAARGEQVQFAIDDDGPGMEADERAHAARRFWRKGRGQGSGLGLSIVDAIAQRYGGTVELLARPGGGLTAQLTLPAVAPRRPMP